MGTWTVTFRWSGVEAETADEAIKRAYEVFNAPSDMQAQLEVEEAVTE